MMEKLIAYIKANLTVLANDMLICQETGTLPANSKIFKLRNKIKTELGVSDSIGLADTMIIKQALHSIVRGTHALNSKI